MKVGKKDKEINGKTIKRIRERRIKSLRLLTSVRRLIDGLFSQ